MLGGGHGGRALRGEGAEVELAEGGGAEHGGEGGGALELLAGRPGEDGPRDAVVVVGAEEAADVVAEVGVQEAGQAAGRAEGRGLVAGGPELRGPLPGAGGHALLHADGGAAVVVGEGGRADGAGEGEGGGVSCHEFWVGVAVTLGNAGWRSVLRLRSKGRGCMGSGGRGFSALPGRSKIGN